MIAFVFSFANCTDERGKVTSADDFVVTSANYSAIVQDTVIVNANDKLTFMFPNGCPDQIMFYSGEAGKEYRFANRGLYSVNDGTVFESRLTLSTQSLNFDGPTAKEDSVFAISGLGKSTVAEFIKSTKLGFKQLRSGATSTATVKDQYVFTASSTPLNLFTGDISFAIRAKSANAAKNMLSLVASTDSLLKNTEIRDYGYSHSSVTVDNKKTIIYPIITSTYSTAAWSQYTPDSTIALGTTQKVANAINYTWATGEIGETYTPSLIDGTISPNKRGVPISTKYPLSISMGTSSPGVPSESWLVSRVVNPCAVIPDAAIILKKVDQSSMKYYQFIYKEKGVYKASFVGINVGTNGTAKVVREFVILVQ